MKAADLRELSREERDKKQKELKTELLRHKSQAASGTPPEKPGRISVIKRTLARIETINNEEESNK